MSVPVVHFDQGLHTLTGHGPPEEWTKPRFTTTYDKTIKRAADEKDLDRNYTFFFKKLIIFYLSLLE